MTSIINDKNLLRRVSNPVIYGMMLIGLNFAFYLLSSFLLNTSPQMSAGIAFLVLIPVHYYLFLRPEFQSSKCRNYKFALYPLILFTVFFLNIFLIWLFWGILQADVTAAQLLALIPVSVCSLLGVKYLRHRNEERVNRSENSLQFKAANGFLIIIAALTIYYSITLVLLYSHEQLLKDEWKFYGDYFFNETLSQSIFSRQNGHLMYLPNILIFSDYAFLSGKTVYLAIANIAFLAVTASMIIRAIRPVLTKIEHSAILRIATSLVIVSCFFSLGSPTTLFWGLTVHNYIVIFGAVGAAYTSSGLSGRLDCPKTFLAVLGFTLIACTSFSVGAAVTIFGFMGAVLARQKWQILLLYFITGVILGSWSLGIWQSGNTADLTTDLSVISALKFVLAFLGSPLGWALNPSLKGADLFQPSLNIGVLGMTSYIIFTGFTVRSWLSNQNTGNEHTFNFLWLLASSMVLAALLVYIGRSSSPFGLNSALFPRFATWGTFFWAILATTAILKVCRIEWSGLFAKYGLIVINFGVLFAVIYINKLIIQHRLVHHQIYDVKIITQIAVNGSERHIRENLFAQTNGQELAIKVIADLSDNQRNIYASNSFRRAGKMSDILPATTGLLCPGSFTLLPTSRRDEYDFLGWAFPSGSQLPALSNIYVVDSSNRISGLGLTIFKHPSHQSNIYKSVRPLAVKLFQKLTILNISNLPGVSGSFYGTIRLTEQETDVSVSDFTFFADDKKGELCRISFPHH